jgi:raffinose/stachyose/melibiose transport system substrate-binding protein
MFQFKWKKDTGLILTFVLLSISLLAGCSSSKTSEPAPSKDPKNTNEAAATDLGAGKKNEAFTLTYWTFSGMENMENNPELAKAIEIFKREYPKAEVKVEGKGRPEQFGDALNVGISAGNPPDIFFSNIGQVVSFYTKNGKVESLEKYAKLYGWHDAYPKSYIDYQKNFLGDFYALPQNYYAMGLWYRKDILEKNNIPEPKTYEELLDAAAKLKANNIVPMVMAGKWPAIITRLFDGILEKVAGAKLHDDLLLGKAKFNVPEVVTAFKKLKEDWGDKEYFQNGYLSAEEAQTNMLWYNGKANFWYSGSWELGNFITNNQDASKYEFMPFPTGISPYRTVAFGNGYYMSSDSKHKDEAAAFLNALSSLEAQQANVARNPNSDTARIGAINLDKVSATKKRIVTLLQDSGSYVPTNEMGTEPRLTDVLYDVMPNVLIRKITPEDAAKRLDEKAQEFGWYK